MKMYFECNSGISGDMSVAALIDAGANVQKLENVLESLKLDNEFSYKISKVTVNAIRAVDFDVILPDYKENEHHHHHQHRNLEDVYKIINKAKMTENAKALAKKIFKITAQAEAEVHGIDISEIHFHEVGAIDSIIDVISFAVLFDDLNPEEVYFSPLTEGTGTVECQHGTLNVPVPAVCAITSKYSIPLKISDNIGEMVTPTGASICAALFKNNKLPDEMIIHKVGYGAGKRHYKNPVLRVILFD